MSRSSDAYDANVCESEKEIEKKENLVPHAHKPIAMVI